MAGSDEEAIGDRPADLWADLCEGFHDLRLRAFGHNLESRWRALVEADPEDPDLLRRWLELAEELTRLDGDVVASAVRNGVGEDDGWWDDFEDDDAPSYACPSERRCSRTAAQSLKTPRCWLSNGDMTPVHDEHG